MGLIIRNSIAYGGGGAASGSDIEVLTQEAYDALVAAGTVDNDKYYFIEDDADNTFDLEILNTMDEINSNTEVDKIAGALAVKEMWEQTYAGLDVCGLIMEQHRGRLETLESNFQDGCSTIAAAITEMGVTTASNASPSTMAANIKQISSKPVLIGTTSANTSTFDLSGYSDYENFTADNFLFMPTNVGDTRGNTINSYSGGLSVSARYRFTYSYASPTLTVESYCYASGGGSQKAEVTFKVPLTVYLIP